MPIFCRQQDAIKTEILRKFYEILVHSSRVMAAQQILRQKRGRFVAKWCDLFLTFMATPFLPLARLWNFCFPAQGQQLFNRYRSFRLYWRYFNCIPYFTPFFDRSRVTHHFWISAQKRRRDFPDKAKCSQWPHLLKCWCRTFKNGENLFIEYQYCSWWYSSVFGCSHFWMDLVRLSILAFRLRKVKLSHERLFRYSKFFAILILIDMFRTNIELAKMITWGVLAEKISAQRVQG